MSRQQRWGDHVRWTIDRGANDGVELGDDFRIPRLDACVICALEDGQASCVFTGDHTGVRIGSGRVTSREPGVNAPPPSCADEHWPSPKPEPPSPPPPPRPVCIRDGPSDFEVRGRTGVMCDEEVRPGVMTCVVVDLDHWTLSRIEEPKPPEPPHHRLPPEIVVGDDGRATFCKADGTECRPIELELLSAAFFDPQRELLVAVGSEGPGQDVVLVFDAATRLPLSRFADQRHARFLGRVLLLPAVSLGEGLWTTPLLADPRSGKTLGVPAGYSPEHLADDQWVFIDKHGQTVLVQDVARGRIVRRIDLRSISPNCCADSWQTASLYRLSPNEMLVVDHVYGNPLVVVDPLRGRVLRKSRTHVCPSY